MAEKQCNLVKNGGGVKYIPDYSRELETAIVRANGSTIPITDTWVASEDCIVMGYAGPRNNAALSALVTPKGQSTEILVAFCINSTSNYMTTAIYVPLRKGEKIRFATSGSNPTWVDTTIRMFALARE